MSQVSALSNQLESHIAELCRLERHPQSPGYFRAQDYLADSIQSLGYSVQRHEFWDRPSGLCCNIYAESQESTGPHILIGAHYDGLERSGPAADDNASAVAVVLELMRILKGQPNLSFVFFDVEENYGWGALHGSKQFARFYPKPLSAVVVLDLVGGSLFPQMEPTYFQFGNAMPAFESDTLEFWHLPIEFLEPLGGWGARSDYRAFRAKGLPYTFVSSGTPWYYHSKDDSPERLSLSKMQALTDALASRLRKGLNPKLEQASWQNLSDLLIRLQAHPELRHEFFDKLKIKQTPSRWDIVRLYSIVLPRLKKLKSGLWADCSH